MKKILFLSIFIGITYIYADDTIFEGSGANIIPSTNTKVRMVSEKVNLKKVNNTIFAKCEFNFLNTGAETEVLMGFPELADIDNHGSLIKDFTVFVNGNKYAYESKESKFNVNLPDLKYYKEFLVWKVHFQEGEKIKVTHTYNYGMGAYLNRGTDGKLYGVSAIYYILKTGALWYGKIGEADISIDLDEPIPPHLLNIQPKGYSYSPNVIHWTIKDFEPKNDIRVSIESEEDYIKNNYNETSGNKKRYFPPYHNFAKDSAMKYIFGDNDDEDSPYLSKYLDLEDKSPKELYYLRNEIFARHGYIFKSQKLQNYFSEQSWYKPKKKFTASDLTEDELYFINKIKRLEKNQNTKLK